MKGINGEEIIEYRFSTKTVTVDGYHELRCSSFILQNKGNTTVTINDSKDLKGTETFGLGTTSPNEFITQKIKIKFGAGVTPLLEITEMIPFHPDLAHYVMKPKIT